jgi:hypothetical protein
VGAVDIPVVTKNYNFFLVKYNSKLSSLWKFNSLTSGTVVSQQNHCGIDGWQ